MYKHRSAAYQRRYKVHEIAPQSSAAGRLCEDDLIPSAQNMGLDDCLAERRQLLIEKTRTETEIAIAKRERNWGHAEFLGGKNQGMCARLGLLAARIKELNRTTSRDEFRQAVQDTVDEATWDRIIRRAQEIRETTPLSRA